MSYPVAACRGRWAVGGAITGVTDTFTDSNGVLLTVHVPDSAPAGAMWSYSGTAADATISSNTLVFASGDKWSYIESGLSNCVVSLDMKGGTIYCGGRVQSAGNLWHLQYQTTNLYLFEVISGGYNLRASQGGLAAQNGTIYQTLTLTFSGNNITGEVVGVAGATVNYTSASYNTETEHGFRSVSGKNYDNFTVT